MEDKKLILGVSGGPDSVYLLHLLAAQKTNLIIAHLNHSLRGKDSDKDEQFVQKLAKKYGYPFESRKIKAPKSEEEARIARYEFLREIRKKHKADLIVTAHHLDDQIETILLNLTRGCGLKGLAGIQPLQRDIYRPLLKTSKQEILDYLKKHKLKYRTDKTNKNIAYARNFLRHKVIPNLKKLNPNLLQTIDQNLANITEIDDYLTHKAKNLIKRNLRDNHYPLARFNALPRTLQKAVLMQIFANKKNISTVHIQEILSIINKGIGKKQKTFQGIRIEISEKNIVFSEVKT